MRAWPTGTGKTDIFYGKRGKREFVPRDQDFSLTCALLFITSTPKLVSSLLFWL